MKELVNNQVNANVKGAVEEQKEIDKRKMNLIFHGVKESYADKVAGRTNQRWKKLRIF